MRKLVLMCLLVLPSQVQAQEERGRMLLEGGIVGGNSIACPGRYLGIEGRVVGPASIYGLIETFQCVELPQTSSRLGGSVRLVPADWPVRPAFRVGLEYSTDGEVSPTAGASLTLGQRYGARFIVERWRVPSGSALVLLHISGYISF